ncbi:fluoride efflux transporter FluC [Agrococcus beijingensis]|uniref:fluoride efflux transporter FluC n=1 Tax=Agrococcus beijingensis TaxID=3068634 RepID=UPI0027412509|nr:CrcB family protein [Agrococcus sp. REN33]
MQLLASAVAVALGGALGSLARALLEASIAHGWALLLVNALGSFALGLSTAALAGAPAWLRHGIGAGLLGGFTTFSAVALASAIAGAGGSAMLLIPALPGIALALGMLAAGLLAAWAGLHAGRALARKRSA